MELPDHGLPVWSILFHPHDPDVILVGCENSEIYRSDDAGGHWTRLPVSVRFPDITTAPGANPAKRILMLDASASEPGYLYGAIEVGGMIRSTDGGDHWENLSHGQYINDDMVDMHGVLASRWRPGTVFGIARAGMWRSADNGDHWTHVPLNRSTPRGRSIAAISARCRATRAICAAPPAPGLSAISASCCAAVTAARAGPRSMSADRCRTRCSRSPSTSGGRA